MGWRDTTPIRLYLILSDYSSDRQGPNSTEWFFPLDIAGLRGLVLPVVALSGATVPHNKHKSSPIGGISNIEIVA